MLASGGEERCLEGTVLGGGGAGDEEARVSAELTEANSLQCSGVTKQAVCPI